MNFEPIQLCLFILAFVPGYIFVQTIDHHLLKGEKTQFEKTVQVLLASTVIWLIAFVWPFLFPVQHHKAALIKSIGDCMINHSSMQSALANNANNAAFLFIAVCIYALLFGNAWGVIRRLGFIDKCIRKLTNRDWYKTVELRFFAENIDSTISINNKNGSRFIGILNGAPDDKSDNSIILSDPHCIVNQNGAYAFVKLAAKNMLIRLDAIESIEIVNKPKRRKLWKKSVRIRSNP